MNLFSFLSSAGFQSGLLLRVLLLPVILIAFDVVTGVTSAARAGTFAWTAVANYLYHDVMKYVGMVLSLGILNQILAWHLDTNVLVASGASATLDVAIIASIVSNLKELFPQAAPAIDAIATTVEKDLGLPTGTPTSNSSLAAASVTEQPTAVVLAIPTTTPPTQPVATPAWLK